MKGAKWGVYRMAREVAKKWGNKFVRDGHNKVYKSFSDVIETKEGRFCVIVLGKQVDYLGRSIISWVPPFYYINVDCLAK